jgi:hypothetical protein
MTLKLTWRALAAAGFALVFAAAASAQQPTRIRGQIEKAEGGMLVLKTRDGASLNVKVADDARVAALNKASVTDIKKDDYIGVAGMTEGDKVTAFSVHIFLPQQKGVVPDRHGPWDARPGSTMTNAYVESIVKEKDGDQIKVKYKDGEKTVVITPQTAVTAVAPGNKDELKAGAQIIIMQSEKQGDGSVLAKVLYVGHGLTPAM